jgi:RHS repeat-associated protein
VNHHSSLERLPASAFRALIVGLFLLFIAATADAQSATDGRTPLGIAPGSPAGSYALSDFDNVNIYNGNLNFRLPLLQVGGRGGAGTAVILPFNNKNWRVVKVQQCPGPPDPTCLDFKYYPTPNYWHGIDPGYGFGVMIGRWSGTLSYSGPCQRLMYYTAVTRLTFKAADGTEYELRDQLYAGEPKPPTGCYQGASRGSIFVTADGTAATFISCAPDGTPINIYDSTDPIDPSQTSQFFPSGFLMLRDGTQYRVDNGTVSWMRDRNGNKMTITYVNNRTTSITDTLKRVVNISYADHVNTFYDEITCRGFLNAQRSIKVWYANLGQVLRNSNAEQSTPYSLQTWKDLFPTLDGSSQTLYDPINMVSRIDLPDGRSYRFYYNSHGQMARVELPTGGAYEYDYTAANDCVVGNEIVMRVLERRVYPNGTTLEGKTVFGTPTLTNPGYYTSTAQVDHESPSGTILASEKHYFWGWPTLITHLGSDYPSWKDSREFKTESLDSSGAVLRRKQETWKNRAPVSWWLLDQEVAPPNDARIVDTVATLTDSTPNLVSRRTAIDPSDPSGETIGFDSYNNPTDVWEYDFGNGSPGALLRHTHTTFLTTNPVHNVNYATDTTIHLRSLPAEQSVYDANAAEQAHTEYEYDKHNTSTGHAPLVDRANITQLDGGFTAAYKYRGNVTKTTRSLLSGGVETGSIITYQQYDIAGNMVKAYDGKLNPPTEYEFDDRFGTPDDEAQANDQNPTELSGGKITYAFPTKVTNALGHAAYTQYDYYLGNPVNGEDPNGVVTKGRYDDVLDRATELVVAENLASLKRRTVFTYNDAAHLITTVSDQVSYSDGLLKGEGLYDGLGRPAESRQYETASAYISTVQIYDALGRVAQTSNPYRPGSESQWLTTTAYDVLGRVTTVTTPDNAVLTTTYLGNATTVRDQANKQRRSFIDAFGRLTSVDEMYEYPSTSVYATTSYGYDVLDDLIGVTQGGQSRTFVYDSLKRLTSAISPESGTINYTYDANSNLQTKIDSRSITTIYAYDALNRPTSRTYTDDPENTPAVSYKYDNQSLPDGFPAGFTRGFSTGRLVAVTYGGTSAGSYTGYDQLGQPDVSYQQTDSQKYGFSYSYNLASQMISETYPSGRVVETGYDTAGRIAGIKNQVTQLYYAGAIANDATNRIQYASHGAISAMKLGNGKWEHTTYDPKRLQPTQIGLGVSSADSSLLKLDYTYNTPGQANNNGNVLTQTITIGPTVMSQSYAYDDVNRLLTASENSGAGWSQTYGYDRFGNRWVSASTGYTLSSLTPQFQSAFNAGNNRLVSSGYDDAGNQTGDSQSRAFTYDAENRQITFNGSSGQYFYDGDGRRVKKIDGADTTVFVYNNGGQLIAEYRNDPVPPPAGGGGTSYLTSDHLGSTRLVTRSDGTVKARYDYLPFGDELGAGIGQRTTALGYSLADSTKQKFTQKERDNESGLDYFGARYYSSPQGRFTSVDPSRVSVDITDPRSWNRYAYTLNNPLVYVDHNGKWPTKIHNQIIEKAFPGLSRAQVSVLKSASYKTDNSPGSQQPKSAFQHGMRARSEKPEDAKNKASEFISQNEGNARRMQNDFEGTGGKGVSKDALGAFGIALHTVTDRTSPAHTDESGNPKVWDINVNSIVGAVRTGIEIKQHNDEESTISPEQIGKAVTEAREAYRTTFGDTLLQQAITEPKAKPEPPTRRRKEDE